MAESPGRRSWRKRAHRLQSGSAPRRALRFESLEERTLLDGGAGDAGGAGASLEAVVAGRLAYHSYTDYGVDGELHVWDFAASGADARAENTVNARVRYAMNPQFSGNGRYLVLMGADRQLPKAWPNLDVFIYDFRTDKVTNLSEALIDAGFLTAGTDWIDEDPSFDPTSLAIAFKRRSGGNSDLWSMQLDGTAQTPIAFNRLTNTSAVEESGPKFSPDGQTIVCWVGAGASSFIASVPAAGGAVAQVVNNANRQDYYPSYWDDGRILYTSWDTNGSGDDDIRVRDLASGADAFGIGGFHSSGEDSDAFAISSTLVGFSSSYQSADGKWRLRYGDPTTGETTAFAFHTTGKHDLGGTYTPHVVSYVPGPERSALPGDYNHDLVVDAADYGVWRDTFGSTVDLRADSSGVAAGVPDGVVDHRDYQFWISQFGKVMEQGVGSTEPGAQSRRVVLKVSGEPRLAGPSKGITASHARRSSPAVVGEDARFGAGGDRALLAYLLRSGDRMIDRPVGQSMVQAQNGDDPIDNCETSAFDAAFEIWGDRRRR